MPSRPRSWTRVRSRTRRRDGHVPRRCRPGEPHPWQHRRVTSTREAPPAEGPLAPSRRLWPPSASQIRLLAGALVLLAVVHAVVVGRHYFVGSFDDDASYILVARALAAGHGLTSRLP